MLGGAAGWRQESMDGAVLEVAGWAWDAGAEEMRRRVSVTLPGHVAHGLAHVLADWSAIAEMMESGRGADETELAGLLHEAARRAGDRETARCDRQPQAGPLDGPTEARALSEQPQAGAAANAADATARRDGAADAPGAQPAQPARDAAARARRAALSRAVRARRAALRLSQREVADRAGCDTQAVRQAENAEDYTRAPTLDQLFGLADALDMTLDELFTMACPDNPAPDKPGTPAGEESAGHGPGGGPESPGD
jgi:DNA-binding XRE family transcriptional regulator